MTTKELISNLKNFTLEAYEFPINQKIVDEIIQRLREYDELRKEIKDLKLEELRKFWQL